MERTLQANEVVRGKIQTLKVRFQNITFHIICIKVYI